MTSKIKLPRFELNGNLIPFQLLKKLCGNESKTKLMMKKEESVPIWSCFPYVARGGVVGDASLEISLPLVVAIYGEVKCKLRSQSAWWLYGRY